MEPRTRPPPAIACRRRPSMMLACYKLLIAACRWIIMTSVRLSQCKHWISYMFPLLTDVPGTLVHRSPAPRDGGRAPRAGAGAGRMCYMPEPSHHQPSQEHPHAFAIGIHDVLTGPPHEGELGEGLLLGRTGATSRRSCIRPRRRSTG